MTDNTNPPDGNAAAPTPPPETPQDQAHPMPNSDADAMGARIDRLSGEPAPDITPEEFARLQRGGSLNLDSRGRIRVSREATDDPGVSLRKRRAWYCDLGL